MSRGGPRPNAGRPLKYGEPTVTVRLPVSLVREVQEALRGKTPHWPIIIRPIAASQHIPSITEATPWINPVATVVINPGETKLIDGKWYKLEEQENE